MQYKCKGFENCKLSSKFSFNGNKIVITKSTFSIFICEQCPGFNQVPSPLYSIYNRRHVLGHFTFPPTNGLCLHLTVDSGYEIVQSCDHISTLFWGAGGFEKLNTYFSLQTTLPLDGILSVPRTFDNNCYPANSVFMFALLVQSSQKIK